MPTRSTDQHQRATKQEKKTDEERTVVAAVCNRDSRETDKLRVLSVEQIDKDRRAAHRDEFASGTATAAQRDNGTACPILLTHTKE